ncbi:MAG: 16S rRNA (guanine(527)-N(7))-methyltransferase RsmG [Armatimonadota bacterium]
MDCEKIRKEIEERIGIFIPEERAILINKYINCIYNENKLYNLTGFKTKEEIFENLIIDSLFIFKIKLPISNKRLLDIGSGAGIPGIPIKLVDQSVFVSAVESNQKKFNFIKRFIDENNIENARTTNKRIEDIARDRREKKKIGSFDIATARAVVSLGKCLEYASPFLKNGGVFVAYKGKKFEEELRDASKCIKKLNFDMTELIKIENTEKKIAVFRKKKEFAEKL